MSRTPHVGISGWTYPPWRKTFYPEGLAHRRELEFASRQVNSIEINGTFYSLPKNAAVFDDYYATVPKNFVFSVKANRFVTHIKKLKDPEEPIANFFASGVLRLGEKLGPILWQFPPTVRFDAAKFEHFLKLLPSDSKAATRVAKHHGRRMDGRARLPDPRAKKVRVRHAIEVRHPSFEDPAFVKLLREHGVALVTADSGGQWPYFEQPTADFVYVRLHGAGEAYVDGYDAKALAKWARKIESWSRTRDVFVYFDNDVKVRAPFDAVDLLRRVVEGYEPAEPMDARTVAGLRTPGPRLAGEASWRGMKKSKVSAGRGATTRASRRKQPRTRAAPRSSRSGRTSKAG